VGELKEKVSAIFENRSVKNYTQSRRLPFQFPNIGAERTPVGARSATPSKAAAVGPSLSVGVRVRAP
jgi:hypothetical protein